MSKNNLGKIVITPRGIWNKETPYRRLDLIYTLEGSFLAREDNQEVSVNDTSVWQPVAGRGPAGSGNVSVYETGLIAGKKYLFIPSVDNSAEGTFEEYRPDSFTQVQSDWDQTQIDRPDFIKNKPELFGGNYNDLKNKPEQFSGNYNDLSNKPNLFSGSYSDLINKPTIPGNLSDLNNDTHFISETQATTSFQRKETGKGLSTNDYTSAEKEKLAGIESGAQRNNPAKHKSATLQPSNWQLFERRYRARIPISGTDTDITTESTIWVAPDGGTVDKWSDAGVVTEAVSAYDGYFFIRANSLPTGNITILYTIGI